MNKYFWNYFNLIPRSHFQTEGSSNNLTISRQDCNHLNISHENEVKYTPYSPLPHLCSQNTFIHTHANGLLTKSDEEGGAE